MIFKSFVDRKGYYQTSNKPPCCVLVLRSVLCVRAMAVAVSSALDGLRVDVDVESSSPVSTL